MKRLIPSQIKEESKVIKSLSLKDLAVLLVGALLLCCVLGSSFPFPAKVAFAIVIMIFFTIAVVTFDMVKGYKILMYWFQYIPRKKKFFNITEESLNITISDCIKMNDGYVSVIEINGIDFGIFDERNQDDYISSFCVALMEITNGKIIKLEKPLDLTQYIDNNGNMLDYYCGSDFKDKEDVGVKNKIDILTNQNNRMEEINTINRVNVEAFYIVICEETADACKSVAAQVQNMLKPLGLCPKVLDERGLRLFTKITLSTDLSEFSEADPEQGVSSDKIEIKSIREKSNKIVINGEKFKILCLGKYPYFVDNAWGHDMFSIDGARVVFNFKKYDGKSVNKVISHSMTELKSRMGNIKLREDEKLKIASNYQSLEMLLEQLMYGTNEALFNTECYFMYPENKHKEIMKAIRSKGIKTNDLLFTQYDGWLSMLPFLAMPDKNNRERVSPIQASSVSAMFPFVSKQLMDEKGSYLGRTNRHLAFWDPFFKSKSRVNGNMVCFGKTGGGKSFWIKKYVLSAAVNNETVIILDPDDEYGLVCRKMKGNWIDVSGEGGGKINPLQVFPSLEKIDESGNVIIDNGDVSSHRVFLADFFRIVFPNMTENCILNLNKFLAELYDNFKIYDEWSIAQLKPTDFPIFDDFLKLIQSKIKNSEKKYDAEEISTFKRLALYIEQIAKGGVYSRLWNGYTTLEIKNKFNVFNFQNLFKNNNNVVANAQMSLLMRFFNQEVIKNREMNKNSVIVNKIVIVIDEAHNFINPRFPIALNFMATMAKQIRKYDGALVVATQNIDDFIGVSAEMKAQAGAVINACQYSMIFGLFADDLNKIKSLYSNYVGGLTQTEIDFVTKAQQGEALFMVDVNTRMLVQIDLFDGELQYIEHIRPTAENTCEVDDEKMGETA